MTNEDDSKGKEKSAAFNNIKCALVCCGRYQLFRGKKEGSVFKREWRRRKGM